MLQSIFRCPLQSVQRSIVWTRYCWLSTATSPSACSPSVSSVSVDKKLLSDLRKKTGFPFQKCREALQKYSNNLEDAENWLQEEAVRNGWSKVGKLAHRPMSQGVLGAVLSPSAQCGVVVQLNCETDFVARNAKFLRLCREAALTCLTHAPQLLGRQSDYPRNVVQQPELAELPLISKEFQGQPLSQLVALTIGDLGENIALTGATFMNINPTDANNSFLACYTHLAWDGVQPQQEGVHFGKYAAIVHLRGLQQCLVDEQLRADGVALARHVVGMNPSRIGDESRDQPAADPDSEKLLIFQPLLHDETKIVKQFLTEKQLQVMDFVRVECGAETV